MKALHSPEILINRPSSFPTSRSHRFRLCYITLVSEQPLTSLHVQPRINLDPHSRHACVPGKHDKSIGTVVKICFMLQRRLVLESGDLFL